MSDNELYELQHLWRFVACEEASDWDSGCTSHEQAGVIIQPLIIHPRTERGTHGGSVMQLNPRRAGMRICLTVDLNHFNHLFHVSLITDLQVHSTAPSAQTNTCNLGGP